MHVRKIKLTIAYDGTDYHGWQVQPGVRTVQETLCQAATGLVGSPVYVHGASRTDAGVHAKGQCALMEVATPIPTKNFPRALTDRLPSDIAVVNACDVDKSFDLFGDVTRKLYTYTLCVTKPRPVMHMRFCWHVPGDIDVTAMQCAAEYLVGKHDFKSFASAADKRQSSVRTIFGCSVTECDEDPHHLIHINVQGDGFLYNMVRNIVGTLVDIGHGRWCADQMEHLRNAKDRTAAGQLAPASGLCLEWIKYKKGLSADS